MIFYSILLWILHTMSAPKWCLVLCGIAIISRVIELIITVIEDLTHTKL